jgi:hypothetical protein
MTVDRTSTFTLGSRHGLDADPVVTMFLRDPMPHAI